ncbi:hypothetical protein LCGC14_3103110, partial [marine sediment metagenome]
MDIDEKQIEQIVEMVLERLSPPDQEISPDRSFGKEDGVFREMEDAIHAAVTAQKQLVGLSLATREKIIQGIRDVCWNNREEYGRMELEETDIGAKEGTVLKLEVACG